MPQDKSHAGLNFLHLIHLKGNSYTISFQTTTQLNQKSNREKKFSNYFEMEQHIFKEHKGQSKASRDIFQVI